jgi:TorA maturation chaperone TorD
MTEFASDFTGGSHVERLLAGRHAICGWLSRVLDGAPAGPAPTPEEAGGAVELADSLRRLPQCGNSADVEGERIRLFVNAPGGVPAPPYGSWWVERKLEGEMTARLAEFYEAEGLRATRGTGPADYIPAELEFLQFLLAHQRAALVTRQDELETQTRRTEREFLDRFLANWIPEFCSAVKAATADRFWLGVIAVLEAVLDAERHRVGAAG